MLLKGVNSTLLSNTTDPGKDGNGSIFPVDVMGYNLHYFEGDYSAIESIYNQSTNRFYGTYSNSEITSNSSNLYNGNIRSMQTTLRDLNSYSPMYMATAYSYDQLNRMTSAVAYQGNDFDVAQNKWIPITTTNQYRNNFTFDANGNILHQTRYDSAGDVIDDMDYNYHYGANGRLVRNRLYHLTETVSSSAFNDDIDPMETFVPHSANTDINASNNYVYDQEGRLVRDSAENLTIEWRVDGKVKRIIDEDGGQQNGPEHKYIEFDYDAMGNRIAKHTYSPTEELIKSTYYLLDAQGNLISTYEHKLQQSTVSYKQVERYMYGSSRLGVFGEETDMLSSLAPPDAEIIYNKVGYKSYEMANHLGNVLTVVTDVVNGDANSGYQVDIASTADYSPFGVQLDGRIQNSGSYRFTFQGQESDDEVKGSGNSVNYKYRMHDPRVGRWKSKDPEFKKYCGLSPYSFTAGNPVVNVEIDGRVFDLGYLTYEQREAYLKKVSFLRTKSKLFDYYYSYLENSEKTYTIDESQNINGPGGYSGEYKYVLFKDIINTGDNVIVQELFHAFQDDLYKSGKIFKGAETKPESNIELEGDLMTLYVAAEYGGSSAIYGWEGELADVYFEKTEDYLSSEGFSKEYSNALDRRIDFWKQKASEPGQKRSYSTYTAPRQEFGPEAIIKVVKEIEATANNLQGPRLENGDYYEN